MQAKDRIIVALDVDSLDKAETLVTLLAPYVGVFKVGLELLTVAGPDAVRMVRFHGGNVMYDGKFNDIPNTMTGAVREVSRLGVKMFTMHASTGEEGMKAAVKASGDSLALAVTVLTSMDDNQCFRSFGVYPNVKVVQFAFDALQAGANGLVCSPKELVTLRAEPRLSTLLMVTPGVRPAWAAAGDQKRVMTPKEAVAAGADYLVIGRPILAPPQHVKGPVHAAQLIAEEIEEALAGKMASPI